jgi:cysteine-rich repeat protein
MRCVRTWMLVLCVVCGFGSGATAYTVVSASHDVRVDCGSNGTDVPTDWYFPVPNPNLGLVWVQHGFSRTNNQYVDLSTKLAAEGYVVFATSLAPGNIGCAMNNAGFLSDMARLFPDLGNPGVGLLASAQAAAQSIGVALTALPPTFAFTGHSAGGGSIAHVARKLVEDHAATAQSLTGLVFLDPVEGVGTTLIADALPGLSAKKLYTVSSPPYTCNSNANGTVALTNQPRPFVGVRLTSGSHCDAEGSSTNSLCTLFCGTSQQSNVDTLQTLVRGWIADLFALGFTPNWYPSGAYYDARLAENRILTLPQNNNCGNGALNPGEQCDDGGRVNGDCCNAICAGEPTTQSCTDDGNPCTTDACSGAGSCVHSPGNANVVCRASAGGCDIAERCTGASGACPADGIAAAGATCRAAVSACGVAEVCDGSGSSCPSDAFGNVGVVCRAAATACDIAEVCDGTGPQCPPDVTGPDADADGACDADDNCPATANPTQADGDGDGDGDECDPCTGTATITSGKLVIGKLNTPPGDDKLSFKGTLSLPFPFVPNLSPTANGARVLLQDGAGVTVIDAAIPPGPYDALTRTGWRGSSTKWSYQSPVGVLGLTKVQVGLDVARPGTVKLKIAGRGGAYPVLVLPAVLTVVLDPPTATSGQCGVTAFAGPLPPVCALNGSGATLLCK